MNAASIIPTWRGLPDKPFLDVRELGGTVYPITKTNYDLAACADQSDYINAAYQAAVDEDRPLLLPNGWYVCDTPLDFTATRTGIEGSSEFTYSPNVPVYGPGARIFYRGDVDTVAITIGGAIDAATAYDAYRPPYLDLGYLDQYPLQSGTVGLRIQNSRFGCFRLGRISRFHRNLHFYSHAATQCQHHEVHLGYLMLADSTGSDIFFSRGSTGSVGNHNIYSGYLKSYRSIEVDASAKWYVNSMTFTGTCLEGASPPFVPISGHAVNWSFFGCSWENQDEYLDFSELDADSQNIKIYGGYQGGIKGLNLQALPASIQIIDEQIVSW